jgi:hypothetical protein
VAAVCERQGYEAEVSTCLVLARYAPLLLHHAYFSSSLSALLVFLHSFLLFYACFPASFSFCSDEGRLLVCRGAEKLAKMVGRLDASAAEILERESRQIVCSSP